MGRLPGVLDSTETAIGNNWVIGTPADNPCRKQL